jgi:hypothetical protein
MTLSLNVFRERQIELLRKSRRLYVELIKKLRKL